MAYWSTNPGYKLKITWDITTYCNAGCPQCDRTDPNGLGKAGWLPLVQWSFDKFKQAISPEDFKYVELCSFVGSWGDPIMNKDIFKIVEYCIENGSKVNIETNGSIRDEEWWWNFGVMGGKNLQVRFDIDGLDQKMHEKYRRFTDMQKVLNHMHIFSLTNGVTASQTVVFKHNQEHLNEIENLCRSYGSKFHTKVISDRFDSTQSNYNGVFTFTDEHGKIDTLEEADPSVFSKPFISGAHRIDVVEKAIEAVNSVKPNSEETTKNQAVVRKKFINQDGEHMKPGEKPKEETQLPSLTEDIQCRWAFPRNNIYVQNDGALIPCCFVGWSESRAMSTNPTAQKAVEGIMRNETFQKLIDGVPNDINVFHNSIKDILTKSEWYTKTLPDSLKSDAPMGMCVRHCSNRIRKKHQLREDSFKDF